MRLCLGIAKPDIGSAKVALGQSNSEEVAGTLPSLLSSIEMLYCLIRVTLVR